MIEGFKNREVLTMPMQYTANLIPGDLRREYQRTGAITLPYEPPKWRERPISEQPEHFRGWADEDPADTLERYIDFLNEADEADFEDGWI